MSVPPLNETLTKLVTSLEPIFEGQPEKLAELKAEVKQFEVSALCVSHSSATAVSVYETMRCGVGVGNVSI